jgi:hypothetical protein
MEYCESGGILCNAAKKGASSWRRSKDSSGKEKGQWK